MVEILAETAGLLDQGEDVVLARIIDDKGSTPRAAGAAMIVRRSGKTSGTIGGGLVEAAAIEKAPAMFEKGGLETFEFTMTSEILTGMDMVCGGRVELLVEHVAADTDATAVFSGMEKARRNGRRCVLVTALPGSSGNSGRFSILPDGSCAGCTQGLADAAAALKEKIEGLAGSALVRYGEDRFWVDVIAPGGTVYLFGAGHVAREVSALAVRVGFLTVVLDDRTDFASCERFPPPAEAIVLDSFDGCFSGRPVDGDSYVVIVTRGHLYDKLVLGQALGTRAGYIGMIGSARKRDTIYKALQAEGFTQGDIDRVHCPIGVNIDAETPGEIAVSIVGEIIQVRAQKKRKTGNGKG
jgi:xanthine dehydrogenase accessory factor